MSLIVSKKEELVGSISEKRGDWIDIVTLELELPEESPRWALQVNASAIVSGMQVRFRIDGQVVNWGFGTGNGPDWEQLQATDLFGGLAPGRHQIALEGSRGSAMRRRLVVVAWQEDLQGEPATIKSRSKKSAVKRKAAKKVAAKKATPKKTAPKKAAPKKAAPKKAAPKKAAPKKAAPKKAAPKEGGPERSGK